MIKKFFKTMLSGFWMSAGPVIKMFIAMGWLPILGALILKVFEINISDSDVLMLGLALCFGGVFISVFIIHCKDALEYSEKNQCDIREAWEATDIVNSDEG